MVCVARLIRIRLVVSVSTSDSSSSTSSDLRLVLDRSLARLVGVAALEAVFEAAFEAVVEAALPIFCTLVILVLLPTLLFLAEGSEAEAGCPLRASVAGAVACFFCGFVTDRAAGALAEFDTLTTRAFLTRARRVLLPIQHQDEVHIFMGRVIWMRIRDPEVRNILSYTLSQRQHKHER